jgi:Ser/Thr protein kinase RdoA (MazF antagonist)
MSEPIESVPSSVLAALDAWEGLAGAHVEALRGGLVNSSYAVSTRDGEFIAQRVNPIFSRGIHENTLAVSGHLAQKGEPSVELVSTRDGRLFVDHAEAGCVRLLVRRKGVTFDVCRGPTQAHSAGALIARFHQALADFDAPLHPLGFPLHDTARHLEDLRDALARYTEHAFHADVARLAEKIRLAVAEWAPRETLPQRVVHGDLKFSNVLFAGDSPPECERALALIDLDTLCRLPLYYDLGDAWRSWCNARGEDESEAELDLAIFEASAEGYLGELASPPDRDELVSLAEGLERLSLEVCARFAADALEESYFDWDPARFASAAEHNWLRARGQWSLHEQAKATRSDRLRFLLG